MAAIITNLKLQNWKSFADAELFLDPLTFLIGTNASGKSNILDALDFLRKLAMGIQLKDIVPSVRGGEEWVIRKGERECLLTVEIDDSDYRYAYSIRVGRSKGDFVILGEKLTRRWRDSAPKDLFYTATDALSDTPTIATRFYTAKRGSARRMDLSRASAVISQVEILPILKEVKDSARQVTEALKHIFILNPQPSLMRNFSKLSDRIAPDGSNIAGVLAGMPIEQKEDVEEQLTKYVKPLPERDIDKVWSECVGRYKTDAMLYCDESWTDGEPLHLDARGMSDGTLRFIAIVTALLTIEEHSLLVIEEVDNGLHPSRSVELVKMLRELGLSKQVDVLCTTHNPVLLDALENTMLPFISFVKRDSQGNSEVNLVENLPNLAKMMASNSLGGLMVNDLMK